MSFALLVAAFALAPPDTAPPQTAPLKPKLICRESEALTGTKIRAGKRCKTAEQWKIEDARRDRIPADLRVMEGGNAGQKRSD
jgi:hypothetical protein